MGFVQWRNSSSSRSSNSSRSSSNNCYTKETTKRPRGTPECTIIPYVVSRSIHSYAAVLFFFVNVLSKVPGRLFLCACLFFFFYFCVFPLLLFCHPSTYRPLQTRPDCPPGLWTLIGFGLDRRHYTGVGCPPAVLPGGVRAPRRIGVGHAAEVRPFVVYHHSSLDGNIRTV